MASAKIWHVCDGTQQMERVEALTGAPRSTFRHDDQVVTFLAESKVAVAQKRDALGSFPGLLKSSAMDIGNFYLLKKSGSERVAGFDADVVYLTPKDSWRYGYRVWSEKKTGLVIQLQTLDLEGRVLEQSAFSELQLDAPVDMGKLTEQMNNTSGYRVVHPEVQKVDPNSEGWAMRHPPAGFKPMACYKRPSRSTSPVTYGRALWMGWVQPIRGLLESKTGGSPLSAKYLPPHCYFLWKHLNINDEAPIGDFGIGLN
jgi:sigma-E factor negative regulatory protein RseB